MQEKDQLPEHCVAAEAARGAYSTSGKAPVYKAPVCIGKLIQVWFDQVLSISLKYVTYRQKIKKISFWASHSIFFNFYEHGIMLAYPNEK